MRPTRPQLLGRLALVHRCMSGNRAFHQRQFTTTKPGTFPGSVMIGTAAGLPGIHGDGLAVDGAVQGLA
ncbi:hypothetical protein D3C81_2008410 [compost metagenome]